MLILSCSVSSGAQPSLSPRSYYADIDDIRMYYEIHGTGEPLLLIHGGIGNLNFASLDYETLGQHFMVIAPECRGQGRTTDSDKELHYHLMAQDLILLLDHLGIEQVSVAGLSDGGNIGLYMAIEHPDRIAKLIAIGSNYAYDGFPPESRNWVQELTIETFPQEAVTAYRELAPDPEHAQVFLEKTKHMWLTEPTLTPDDLGTIRCPTLIMAGDHEIISLNHLVTMFHSIPGSQLYIVPGSTHGVSKEKPDLVNNAIVDFVQNGTHYQEAH